MLQGMSKPSFVKALSNTRLFDNNCSTIDQIFNAHREHKQQQQRG